MAAPVVITCALTGGIHGKEANPNLPEQPDEIVEQGVAAAQAGAAILHVHGNAGHVANHAEFSAFLTQAGFHVLVFDYRGYGRSDDGGRLTRAKLVADTHAALDYLLRRDDVDPERIGMLGYSLGGVIGLAAAAEREEGF